MFLYVFSVLWVFTIAQVEETFETACLLWYSGCLLESCYSR